MPIFKILKTSPNNYCDECGMNATHQFIVDNQGKVLKVNLCRDCLRELGTIISQKLNKP